VFHSPTRFNTIKRYFGIGLYIFGVSLYISDKFTFVYYAHWSSSTVISMHNARPSPLDFGCFSSINQSNLIFEAPICRQRIVVETSRIVQCMRCRTVRSLACFVGMSWRNRGWRPEVVNSCSQVYATNSSFNRQDFFSLPFCWGHRSHYSVYVCVNCTSRSMSNLNKKINCRQNDASLSAHV